MANFGDNVKPFGRIWLRPIDDWFREYAEAGLLGDDPLPEPTRSAHPTIARVEVAGELDVHTVENRGAGQFIARCRAPLVIELVAADPDGGRSVRQVAVDLTLAIEWFRRRVSGHRVDGVSAREVT